MKEPTDLRNYDVWIKGEKKRYTRKRTLAEPSRGIDVPYLCTVTIILCVTVVVCWLLTPAPRPQHATGIEPRLCGSPSLNAACQPQEGRP